FLNDGASATPEFWSTANTNSFATGSWTPPTSGLLVLFVGDEVGSGTPNQPTVSGNSVAWTAIKTINVGVNRLTPFAANSAGSAAFERTASASWSTSSAWLGIAAELTQLTNYQLEVRYDWSGVASGSPSYALKVEAYHTVGEDFLVQVLTPPSTWTTRITITKTADDNAAQAYTMTTAEFNSGAPAVRFIGATEIGDVTQSDLY